MPFKIVTEVIAFDLVQKLVISDILLFLSFFASLLFFFNLSLPIRHLRLLSSSQPRPSSFFRLKLVLFQICQFELLFEFSLFLLVLFQLKFLFFFHFLLIKPKSKFLFFQLLLRNLLKDLNFISLVDVQFLLLF